MRRILLVMLGLLVSQDLARAQAGQRYEIVKDSVRVSKAYQRADGKIVIDVRFQLKSLNPSSSADDARDVVVIKEGGHEVHRIDLQRVRAGGLTTVLAMDVSGTVGATSERGKTKMRAAQDAARVFLDRLPPKADAGLVLYDQRNAPAPRYPAGDQSQAAAHRRELAGLIESARPDGRSAYLDACHEALSMLSKSFGDRAVVLVTDGIDTNSKQTADDVVGLANQLRVPVYILGVGDAGWTEPLSSVLVLDHSGSMAEKSGSDNTTRMQALHAAATRYVELMRPGARATLLPFSTRVEEPQEFTDDKQLLKDRILKLSPSGGTAIYDATYAGIETVVALRPRGKRYVIALTDGVDEDPGSKHNPEQVIQLARDESVALYMLGLGRPEDINEAVMKRMAAETGGRYEHAGNQAELNRIFESLSKDLHGEGIDHEKTLQALAEKTGGRYYRARDADQLKLLYGELAGDLEDTHTVTFPSLRQRMDALPSAIDIVVVDGAGRAVSDVGQGDSFRSGLVVAEINYLVYLIMLAGLLALLKLPSALRRLSP